MEMFLVSSLEKVFWDSRPNLLDNPSYNIVPRDEVFSFQAAAFLPMEGRMIAANYTVQIKSELANIKVRQVGHVPSQLPAYPGTGEDYLRNGPGFYPDVLEDADTVKMLYGRWNSLWFDVHAGDAPAGVYPITIMLLDKSDAVAAEVSTSIQVVNAQIPKSHFIHTEWLHTDCIANYYQIDVFSDEYWRIVGNFMKAAVDCNVNMILTPVFTPPLDTEIGGERLTVQLVDVCYANGVYSYNFDKLGQWIDLAHSVGIQYFEISHLFTQWGAYHAPKIMVTDESGTLTKKFGWDTDALGHDYVNFLQSFMPALRAYLRFKKVEDKSYFHISDEPDLDTMEQYKKIHGIMKPLMDGCNIFDALSNADFFVDGLVDIPVIATDSYAGFETLPLKERWVYYCCAQITGVSNRFFAMPSARTRILGVQLYLYRITGFLHWALNFYNSQYSIAAIDPYTNTDSSLGFPSGDAFLVYPGANGQVLGSLRSANIKAALDDFHALMYLENLTSRDFVENLIHEGLKEKITFEKYPTDAAFLLKLRARVMTEIAASKLTHS